MKKDLATELPEPSLKIEVSKLSDEEIDHQIEQHNETLQIEKKKAEQIDMNV